MVIFFLQRRERCLFTCARTPPPPPFRASCFYSAPPLPKKKKKKKGGPRYHANELCCRVQLIFFSFCCKRSMRIPAVSELEKKKNFNSWIQDVSVVILQSSSWVCVGSLPAPRCRGKARDTMPEPAGAWKHSLTKS